MLDSRFDSRLFELIPHRPPMLLINEVLSVDEKSSSARVRVDEASPFFEKGHGVPAWIGLEYMGQTAALIAGHQLQQGLVSPHLGFLLGTRAFKAECSYFEAGQYTVRCDEKAIVGDGLATFDCFIETYQENSQTMTCLATASLSVFRRQI
ncbi:ApeP family dehydratase [Alteromonas gilva]|uniref:3-hydroxylacyl-ACP dehydratase n=1 Tax=Alteromonas gilva TaxID=2987522 RepID=A0ABT5KXH1_9ALTE|nr:hypothetical protein [Alteromonas gilva]MDC8829460.1 hypothetical protein [Alteromonas gilva]